MEMRKYLELNENEKLCIKICRIRINKMWCIYTAEYYLPLKGDEI